MTTDHQVGLVMFDFVDQGLIVSIGTVNDVPHE
jgi:hypothetical protein